MNTAELAERVRGRPSTRFVAAAKGVQDVLGEHQDGAVAEQVLDDLGGLLGAETMLPITALLIAVLAWLGLQPRISEYL